MKDECADILISRALAFQKNGNLNRAGLIYRSLIKRKHDSARVLTNYGAVCHGQGKRELAIILFKKALLQDPEYGDAWHNLLVDAEAGSAEDILRIAETIIHSYPNAERARAASAQAYLANGKPTQAREILDELLNESPDDLLIRELVVRCNLALGDLDSATVHLLYIISLSPGDPFASTELAEISLKAGDSASALQILNSALDNNPGNHAILFQIARLYQSGGQLNKAISLYKQSLESAPERGNIMANLAYSHAEIGEVGEFLAIYSDMLSKGMATPENLVPLVFICSTLGNAYLDKLREYSKLIWSMRAESRAHASSKHPHSRMDEAAVISICSPIGRRKPRVGVLTGDLGTHVVASFLASFLLNYSKDVLEVEVISNRWRNDEIAYTLSEAVDHCISIADYNESAAGAILNERNYDIIIETSGFTSGTAMFLLDQRRAPIQCHWIGYHASTYMPAMDYFIGDSILTPTSIQGQFSEKLAPLPRAWLAATPFTAIPEAKIKQPDEEIIIGSFSQIAKLTAATLSMWGEVLSRSPRVKLMLKDKFVGDLRIQERIMKFIANYGIAEDRVIFQPRTADWFQHMTLYNQLDLALDTTPWSSATTAFDALSMGVPLVSLLGETAAARMSSSVLHHCGKPEWIAESADQYVNKCLSVIDEIQHHRRSKRDYQANVLRSQLYDGPHMARTIEQFVLSL